METNSVVECDVFLNHLHESNLEYEVLVHKW